MKLTKGMKKALSLLLSAAMVVTGVNVTTNSASAAEDAVATAKAAYEEAQAAVDTASGAVTKAEKNYDKAVENETTWKEKLQNFQNTESYEASLYFGSRTEDWSSSHWCGKMEESTITFRNAMITKDGTYTVKIEVAEDIIDTSEKICVLCVDIPKLSIEGQDAAKDDMNELLSVDAVKIDGQDVTIDETATVQGNREVDNDKYRLEFYNEYGTAKISEVNVNFASSIEVTFKVNGLAAYQTAIAQSAQATIDEYTKKVADMESKLAVAKETYETAVATCAAKKKAYEDAVELAGTSGGNTNTSGDNTNTSGDNTNTSGDNTNTSGDNTNTSGTNTESAPATQAPADVDNTTPAPATPEPAIVDEEDGYDAFMMITNPDWSAGIWNPGANKKAGGDAKITGNGTYTVSVDSTSFENDPFEDGYEMGSVFCVDMNGLAQATTMDASDLKVTNVSIAVDGEEIELDQTKVFYGDIETNGNLRIDLYNEYGLTADDPGFEVDDFVAFESIDVTFTIEGLKAGTTPTNEETFLYDAAGNSKIRTVAVEEGDDPDEVVKVINKPTVAPTAEVSETEAPATDDSATSTGDNVVASNAPATVASNGGVTNVTSAGAVSATNSAIAASSAAVKGTETLKAAKKMVVVAPGKKTTVKYTVKKAAAASSAAVVKATSQSKKVATVSLKAAKKQVVIKVPKKAVKGASTTVTLQSKKTNGKAISAKIKVYVRNTAKKIKPAKKSITVKKNKTTKLVLKASGKIQNKKKPVVDTVTVAGKIVKLTAVKYDKKKITLTLKGNKKAKKKAVTIKVGSKKVKVKVTVK